LCPRQLGLLDLPQTWANSIREVFNAELNVVLDTPTRVAMQTLSNGDIVIHNYNQTAVDVQLSGMDFIGYTDGFGNVKPDIGDNGLSLNLGPRSRVWLRKE